MPAILFLLATVSLLFANIGKAGLGWTLEECKKALRLAICTASHAFGPMKRTFIITLFAISTITVTAARAGVLDDWGKQALTKQFFMEYRIKFHQASTQIASITLD